MPAARRAGRGDRTNLERAGNIRVIDGKQPLPSVGRDGVLDR